MFGHHCLIRYGALVQNGALVDDADVHAEIDRLVSDRGVQIIMQLRKPILFAVSYPHTSSLLSEHSKSISNIVLPLAIEFRSIMVIESAKTLPPGIYPLPIVPVSE